MLVRMDGRMANDLLETSKDEADARSSRAIG